MGSWGAIIMGFFGACFASLTLDWQFGVTGATLASPFLGFALISLAAVRVLRQPGKGTKPSKAVQRAFIWSSTGEGIGLFLAANIVINLHHEEWLLPVMALVVGAHFIPIAIVAKFRSFMVLGVGLIVAGLIGFLVAPPTGGAIAGFLAAAGLWIAALAAVRREARAKRGSTL